MIDCGYAEIGKRLGLPTHAYLGMSDAKIVDAQAGLESAGGVILAALSGVNMVSGAGMLDFESCQSPEKLVIDAEIIGMAKRLLAGIAARETPIALTLMRELGHRADYLAQEHTLRWFQEEFYIPSEVIDRASLDGWKGRGSKSTFERARERAVSLLAKYEPPALPEGLPQELRKIATHAAQRFGMDALPPLPHA